MPRITMYTTNSCPYCHAAKNLLNEKKVPFDEVNVSNDDAKRAWLRRMTGRTTVPQIFIGSRPIGGFDDLNELNRTGELDKMLKGEFS